MKVGDKVTKTGGDYTFDGTVVSMFTKLSGQVRVVVENKEGLLHIFNQNQLTVLTKEKQ